MSAAVVEDALTAELDKLGAAPAEDSAPRDEAPAAKPRRRRASGTSGAERARRAKAAAEGTAPKSPPRKRTGQPKIADGMAQLYTMVGLAVGMVPSGQAVAVPAGVPAGVSVTAVVGTQLVANAGAIGAAWEEAAKNDPRVRDALEKLLTVSTFGQIIAAHLPVVLAGLAASGMAPAQLVGFETVAPAPPTAASSFDGQNTGGRP